MKWNRKMTNDSITVESKVHNGMHRGCLLWSNLYISWLVYKYQDSLVEHIRYLKRIKIDLWGFLYRKKCYWSHWFSEVNHFKGLNSTIWKDWSQRIEVKIKYLIWEKEEQENWKILVNNEKFTKIKIRKKMKTTKILPKETTPANS